MKKWYKPYEKEFNTVIGTAHTLLYKRDTVFSTSVWMQSCPLIWHIARLYLPSRKMWLATVRWRRVQDICKPIELDMEYLVVVYGGPPLMGVKPEKKNIRTCGQKAERQGA